MKHRTILLFLAVALAAAGLSCGDSDDTPLGSEFVDDLLGSRPGVVFQDSIPIVAGDTVYSYYRPIDSQIWFEVGVQDDYERLALVKADFSAAGNDTLLTVLSATLRLTHIEFTDYVDQINALFYRLGTEYTEGDSLTTVDTTSVIPDPDTGALVRRISRGILAYELPPELVQGWIRGDSVHNGIAIVYADASANELMGIESREGSARPSIQVNFEGGTSTNYPVSDDGTVARPLSATNNLVVSDGLVRRVFVPIDLSQINDSSAVHEATLVFNIVPGSVFGGSRLVELYVPASADPASEEFLNGTRVTSATLDEDAGVLEIPVTNVLLFVLSGELADNGYVLRFVNETSEVRQVEFYPGSHGTLGPKVFITYSTPAEFDR